MKRSTIKIIRFELRNPDGGDIDRLPPGVKGDASLMMWKELCRTGRYETDGVEHVIDEAFLQHLVDVFFKRQKKGVEVPCPIGHTHDPEKKRGRVLFLELRKKKDGVSLYGIIEFVSAEAKEALCHSDVSIDAPESVCDGDGERHLSALDHVAFTDYPVVAGMDKFKDVRFSIISRKTGGKPMTKRKQFETPEDDDSQNDERELENENEDEEKEEKELARKKRLARKKKFSEDKEEKNEKFSDDEEEFSNDDEEEEEFSDDEEDDEEEETLSRKKKFAKNKRFSRDSLSFSLLRENRQLRIDGMLFSGQITAAQSRMMKSMYCSDQAVRFSLEHNSDRDFKNACRLLEAGLGTNYDEASGIQFSSDRAGNGSNVLDKIFDSKYSK
ncbi:MAG: hypothetical protein Q4D98_14355 [Planctomycetia bacterium]|nr:hypothetical protein [Planctomycetia bacterium]